MRNCIVKINFSEKSLIVTSCRTRQVHCIALTKRPTVIKARSGRSCQVKQNSRDIPSVILACFPVRRFPLNRLFLFRNTMNNTNIRKNLQLYLTSKRSLLNSSKITAKTMPSSSQCLNVCSLRNKVKPMKDFEIYLISTKSLLSIRKLHKVF